MKFKRIRPRLRYVVEAPRDDALSRLVPRDGVEVRIAGHHASVTLARGQHRFYTPTISLEFTEREGVTVVDAIVGPQPAIWTFYAFLASNIAIAAVFAMIIGLTQLMLDATPWTFIAIPAAIALLAGLYSASQVGRSLAEPQTDRLRSFLRESLRGTEEPV